MNNLGITKDSAVYRGIVTAVQAFIALAVGLFTTVWAIPGVPEAVISYLQNYAVQLGVSGALLTGLVSLAWNLVRKDVKNV